MIDNQTRVVEVLKEYESIDLKEAIRVIYSHYDGRYMPFSFVAEVFRKVGLPPLRCNYGEVFFDGYRGMGIKYSDYWEAIGEPKMAESVRRSGQ